MIRMKHLDKYFHKGSKNELHVVNDISLEFGNTGLVCILGESGSGKTTLLNVLGGLDTFHGGELQIDDTILKKYQPSKIEPLRNEKFGYIFQNYFLLQDYTVEYNVKLALNLYDLTEEEKDARVDYVLRKLRINRYKKKLVSKLSGGQQQRVSIARALVKSPQIILADEPTGNLDEENTIRTMNILKSISKECLVILVSHERRIVEFFADRIIEIRDGQIIRDQNNTIRGSYQMGDDANIYLQEMDKSVLENQQGQFDLYRNADSDDPPIHLILAWKNGKLYIQNLMEEDVVLAGEESGCQILDEKKPEFDLKDMENFSFALERLPSKKTAKLSQREIFRMALENIRLMGKKQAFVVIVLLTASILLTIGLADFSNAILVDETQVVETDSHYVTLYLNWKNYYEPDEMMKAMKSVYDTYLADSIFGDQIFIDSEEPLSIAYPEYYQLRNSDGRLDRFSYVSLEHLQEKDLIYGRMPEKYNEVVVDRMVVERFLSSGKGLANIYDTVEEFVGKTVAADIFNQELDIVGICDTGEVSLYCGQNILLSFSVNSSRVASVSDLQKEHPGQYDDLVLTDDQILVQENNSYRKAEWKDGKRVKKKKERLYDADYRIAGTIPDEEKFEYILTDTACSNLRHFYVMSKTNCKIYLEDMDRQLPQLQQLVDEINTSDYADAIEAKVLVPYEKQMQEYKKAHSVGMDNKKVFAAAILFLSLIMLYFTVKSSVVSRSEELTVYRLLGIGKGSILRTYLLEMIFINTYTSLPTILLTSVVLKLVSSIPSLKLQLLFPWWMILLLIVAFYLLNILVSILPVKRVLAKPPAQLALKD